MNAFRKKMMDEGGNLSWCKPYVSENQRIKFSVNEGAIASLKIDGVEVDATAENVKKAAQIANSAYDAYDGWDDTHILVEAASEQDCCDCPWFDVCEAMDDPCE